MAHKHTISIITVCYNAQDTIKKTVESVINQTSERIEYIVVDGQSTDSTLQILNNYNDHIDQLISEPDTGIFNAMNKGIQHTSGDIIYFLNSNDTLYENKTIETVLTKFDDNPEESIICGKAYPENLPDRRIKNYFLPYVGTVSKGIDIVLNPLVHQRVFTKRSVFDDRGLFDENFKICADYNWLVKYIYAGGEIEFIEPYVIRFDTTGVSNTNSTALIKEKIKFLSRNIPLLDFLHYLIYAAFRNIFPERRTLNLDWDH